MKKIFIYILLFSITFSQVDEDMVCDITKLSYIKTDQLLGVLKSMGYNVIEFQAEDAENFSDMNFIPSDIIKKPLSIIKFPKSEIGYLQSYTSGDSTNLGSSPLPHLTSGEPLQRILVCYDKSNIDPYIKLIEYIKNNLDVGAKQIIIDALVIEINSNDIKEFEINLSDDNRILLPDFIIADSSSGIGLIPKLNNISIGYGQTGAYTEIGKTVDEIIDIHIKALIKNTSAEILSKPSVLVLDGRQARIQVGEQIPITKVPITSTGEEFLIPDVEYLPVGITLNLRPRISEDGRQITMQVETIITEAESMGDGTSDILSAPVISNRKVESFVRIRNNTPFIVGGLISNKSLEGAAKVPFLHKIPILGHLFKSNTKSKEKREVIVVITPHIIEDNYQKFSKVIPQDSDFFNSTGNKLFANSYRLEEQDIWDLDFIFNSVALHDLRNRINNLSNDNEMIKKIKNGYIPGENIIVQRMLFDIIKKSNYFSYIDPYNIIYFDEANNIQRLTELDQKYIGNNENEGVILVLKDENSQENVIFQKPLLTVDNYSLKSTYKLDLRNKNKLRPSIILSNERDRRKLIEVLILKYLLQINEGLDLTIDLFKRGLEIQFPNPDILEKNTQLIDKSIIETYNQINDYYYYFEMEFNKQNNNY